MNVWHGSHVHVATLPASAIARGGRVCNHARWPLHNAVNQAIVHCLLQCMIHMRLLAAALHLSCCTSVKGNINKDTIVNVCMQGIQGYDVAPERT